MREVTSGHALIINYQDADAVAGALRKIVADQSLTARLRADGLSRAGKFTFEKLTAERITAFGGLVASHPCFVCPRK
jgi:hypothetical protein